MFKAIKGLFTDFLIWSSGTWVGSPSDEPADDQQQDADQQS